MQAYWRVYGYPGVELEECRTYEELRSAVTHTEPSAVWRGYYYNDSSTEPLFSSSPGQKGPEGEGLHTLLSDLNRASDMITDVTLLYSGVEGGSSHIITYSNLYEEFPRLRFRLAVVMEGRRTWHKDCFYNEPGIDNSWVSFDVDDLARIQKGEGGDEHHARVLLASNIVQYLNLDYYGLDATGRGRFGISPEHQNSLGRRLSSSGRKTFALTEIEQSTPSTGEEEGHVTSLNATEYSTAPREVRSPVSLWFPRVR
ncbi:hypothetical protein LTR10_005922 [Elasticomyces elasticus]|nr:hypothetical protein LTR10_005922 [Elasticomyces elasticus]